MVTLQRKNVSPYQVSAAGEPYINFRLIFHKTNKDPTNGKEFALEASRQIHKECQQYKNTRFHRILRCPTLTATHTCTTGLPIFRKKFQDLWKMMTTSSRGYLLLDN